MIILMGVLSQTLITVGLLTFLIFVIYALRKQLNFKQESIHVKHVVFIYGMIFVLLALSIILLLWVWGYDASDYIGAMILEFTAVLENSVPRLVATLISVFVSLTFYKISKISLFRFGKSGAHNQRRKQTISKVSLSIVKYIIGIVLVLSILSIWGINVGPAVAGLGIAGLVIGLGAQKFINDLISGFFIIFENHYDVGDWVEIGGFMGEVIDIGLKTTKVRNFKGEVKIFNNGSIDPVSNFMRSPSLAVVDFGIAYKEDVANAIAVLQKHLPAMKEQYPVMVEEPRVLGVTDLANSSVNLRVVVKVLPMEQWGIERALRQRIKEILVQHKIEIPFPQVVVHQAK